MRALPAVWTEKTVVKKRGFTKRLLLCYDNSVQNALIGKKGRMPSLQRAAGRCKAVGSAVTPVSYTHLSWAFSSGWGILRQRLCKPSPADGEGKAGADKSEKRNLHPAGRPALKRKFLYRISHLSGAEKPRLIFLRCFSACGATNTALKLPG